MPTAQAEATPPAPIYLPSPAEGRLHQGELLQGVREWVAAYTDDFKPSGAGPMLHKLAVVLTQDCDLERDWRTRENEPRKLTDLRSIVLCPAAPADELRDELRSGDNKMMSSKGWELVRQNKAERYQYLAEVANEHDAGGDGHPAMLVDFMGVFSVRTVELYRQIRAVEDPPCRRRCRLATPWREHLQARFAAYQARIGLPQDHFVPKGRRPELPPATAPAPGGKSS